MNTKFYSDDVHLKVEHSPVRLDKSRTHQLGVHRIAVVVIKWSIVKSEGKSLLIKCIHLLVSPIFLPHYCFSA